MDFSPVFNITSHDVASTLDVTRDDFSLLMGLKTSPNPAGSQKKREQQSIRRTTEAPH